MKRLVPAFAAILLAACADPSARWLGDYRGSFASTAVDCDTGERLEPVASTITVSVVMYRGGLAIDGECPIVLEMTSDTTARIPAATCEGTLSDGTAVRYETLNGRVELDGDELAFTASQRVIIDGLCDLAEDSFVGTRQ